MDEASVVAELLVRDGCADDREACWRHLKDPQGAPAPALSAPPGSPESAWCHTFVVDDGRLGKRQRRPRRRRLVLKGEQARRHWPRAQLGAPA